MTAVKKLEAHDWRWLHHMGLIMEDWFVRHVEHQWMMPPPVPKHLLGLEDDAQFREMHPKYDRLGIDGRFKAKDGSSASSPYVGLLWQAKAELWCGNDGHPQGYASVKAYLDRECLVADERGWVKRWFLLVPAKEAIVDMPVDKLADFYRAHIRLEVPGTNGHPGIPIRYAELELQKWLEVYRVPGLNNFFQSWATKPARSVAAEFNRLKISRGWK